MHRRSTRPHARLFALLIALALLATACGGGSDDTAAPSSSDDNDAAEATSDDPPDTSDDSAEPDAEPDEPSDSADEPEPELETESADTVEVIEDDPSDDPVFGGTLRYGIEADVDGLNPTTSALSAPGALMGNAVFDTLAVIGDDGEAYPNLAESWEPNDDFTSWTVKLRPGITFHDGTPFDAEAVRFGFETIIADPLVGLAVAPFYPTVDEGAFEIIDDLTVRYTLLEPNANFPTGLATTIGMAVSPTWAAAALEDPTLNQQPVGTGPFKFDGRSEDSVTRFVRNEDWWGGDVYLDAIEFVPVTDSNNRIDLFLQGELQAMHTTNNETIFELREEEGVQNVLDDAGEEFFIMMNSANPPFDDIRVRQALSLATPKQNFLDLIALGLSQPADQMFTPSSPYYVEGVTQDADRPEEATPLIDAYCSEVPDSCTDGRVDMELQWSGPSVVQTRIAELLEQGWSDHFNVNFQELPQDAHIQETAFGLYDVVTWRQFGAVNPGDDRVWLACKTVGPISLNWPRYCDEERDALLNELQLASTVEARQPILEELVRKINEDYLYIFMNHTMWDNAFAENVRGVCGHTSPDDIDMRCSINGRTWHSNVWLAPEG